MHLTVRVIPNAKKFSVSFKDGISKTVFSKDSRRNVDSWMWKVHVPAKAEGNKANAELVGVLAKILGTRVSLVRGAKSRIKVLEIEGSEDEIAARMRALAQEYESK